VKSGYIIAIADSLIPWDTAALAGSPVVVTVYARNSMPVRYIEIPVEYSGVLDLTLDSFSTAGCRTDYFEVQTYIHYDVGAKSVTIKLQSSNSGTSPDLSPGTGAIIKLHFLLSPSAVIGETADVMVDGYGSFSPRFSGPITEYEPINLAGTVSVCPERGNVDGTPGITIADLTYLVDYLFRSGPPPFPIDAGDIDCLGGVNISDLTYLVNYLFRSGPPPCSC
jgi:hypothetical protein